MNTLSVSETMTKPRLLRPETKMRHNKSQSHLEAGKGENIEHAQNETNPFCFESFVV